MGIVYNGTYFAYLEVGRTELMRSYNLPYTDLEKAGFFLPLISAHLDYKQPAYYDDILKIEATLLFDNKPKIRFDYNIFKDNTTIAVGYTVHCFMNATSRKPVRPPAFFIDKLNNLKT